MAWTTSRKSTLTQPTLLSGLWTSRPKAQPTAYIESIIAILSQLQVKLTSNLIQNYRLGHLRWDAFENAENLSWSQASLVWKIPLLRILKLFQTFEKEEIVTCNVVFRDIMKACKSAIIWIVRTSNFSFLHCFDAFLDPFCVELQPGIYCPDATSWTFAHKTINTHRHQVDREALRNLLCTHLDSDHRMRHRFE